MRKIILALALALAASLSLLQQARAESCENLSIDKVTASGHQIGSYASRAFDDSLSTGCAIYGIGSWIQVDLGKTRMVCSVDIAWYRGDVRGAHFAILTSLDGEPYKEV